MSDIKEYVVALKKELLGLLMSLEIELLLLNNSVLTLTYFLFHILKLRLHGLVPLSLLLHLGLKITEIGDNFLS